MKPGTHQGHCQACGRMQVRTSARRIAKHGYNVQWGYFSGVCHGSGHQPLEIERTYTDKCIIELRDMASRDRITAQKVLEGKIQLDTARTGKMIAATRDCVACSTTPGESCAACNGTKKVVIRNRWNQVDYIHETVAWADASPELRLKEVNRVAESYQTSARRCDDHAKFLERLAKDYHGKPLRAREPKKVLRKFKEGEAVKLHGNVYTFVREIDMGRRVKYAKIRNTEGRTLTPTMQALRKQNP